MSVETKENTRAFYALMDKVIADIELDLSGLTVLTEAASGDFACTALMAARAGADAVWAVTRDSDYGEAATVIDYNEQLAREFGVADRIIFSAQPAIDFTANASIVTNTGFVRPITAALIEALPDFAAIPLMWEPWEFRSADLDIEAARRRGLPVAGTAEDHPRLQTIHHLGRVALRLLSEKGIASVGAKIGVIGSYPFGPVIAQACRAAGAETLLFDPLRDAVFDFPLAEMDVLILAEHRYHDLLLGGTDALFDLADVSSPPVVIHICGGIEYPAFKTYGWTKYPEREVPVGYMTVTTAYGNPAAVIDLHAVGLLVGGIMARSMQEVRDAGRAVARACDSGFGAALGSRRPEDYKV